jgi:hypothetical protein
MRTKNEFIEPFMFNNLPEISKEKVIESLLLTIESPLLQAKAIYSHYQNENEWSLAYLSKHDQREVLPSAYYLGTVKDNSDLESTIRKAITDNPNGGVLILKQEKETTDYAIFADPGALY